MRSGRWIVGAIAVAFLGGSLLLARTGSALGRLAGLVLLVFAVSAVPLAWVRGPDGPGRDPDDPLDPPDRGAS
jgi:membrane-associated PAP2 superfamily phosphatase